jgi:hypothetical protein
MSRIAVLHDDCLIIKDLESGITMARYTFSRLVRELYIPKHDINRWIDRTIRTLCYSWKAPCPI